MVTFIRTPVRTIRTLGDHIRKARFTHGLTLEEVSRILVIQKKHLERIENNDFGAFGEEIYLENVLRTYSTYLGFSWDEIRGLYEKSKALYSSAAPGVYSRNPSPQVRSSHLWVTPHIIRTALYSLLVTACFSYIIFLGYQMVRPPQLLIVSPQNNSLSAVESIEVVGRADLRAQVSINGEIVAKTEEGVFHQLIGLQEGVNVITVAAAKKFGPQTTESRTVIFSRQPFDSSSATQEAQQVSRNY